MSRKSVPASTYATPARRVIDGKTIAVQVVHCSDPICKCQFEKRIGRSPYPHEALAKFARHMGWTAKRDRATFLCPDHAR